MIRTQALSESRTLRLATVTLMYFVQDIQLGLMTVALPVFLPGYLITKPSLFRQKLDAGPEAPYVSDKLSPSS